MSILVKVEDYTKRSASFSIDHLPDKCPICHCHIDLGSFYITGYYSEANDGRVQFIARCPRNVCESFFVCIYKNIHIKGSFQNVTGTLFCLTQCLPVTHQKEKFSEEIQSISPEFVAIYNDALAAESDRLNHVIGCGYRKALEFLIKDFLIKHKKLEAKIISKTALGNCIKDHVTEARIRKTAEPAVWLGNDYTHYERKMTDLDIQDLKQLIRLTVLWVESEIITDQLAIPKPT